VGDDSEAELAAALAGVEDVHGWTIFAGEPIERSSPISSCGTSA
jgi:hypothetical protein